jgi:hypothetical protein
MKRFLKRLLRDSFLAVLSGLLGGLFTTIILVAFSDDLRDLSIRVRTVRPPGHVLLIYDPRDPPDNKPVAYNVYGVREDDNFEGVFGKRNGDGTTDFDKSGRFKGFARDGQIYFSYAPIHAERFGAGQFQSVARLDRDLYLGLIVGLACDDSGANSIQRVMVGILAPPYQQQDANNAAKRLLKDDLKSLYALDLSRRDCKFSPKTN